MTREYIKNEGQENRIVLQNSGAENHWEKPGNDRLMSEISVFVYYLSGSCL
jgi:hypothetical protein